jgi:hypothetical protein
MNKILQQTKQKYSNNGNSSEYQFLLYLIKEQGVVLNDLVRGLDFSPTDTMFCYTKQRRELIQNHGAVICEACESDIESLSRIYDARIENETDAIGALIDYMFDVWLPHRKAQIKRIMDDIDFNIDDCY